MKTDKWDLKFIELARHISGWSKDKNTKVGAILVNDSNRIISTGYNGFVIGCDDSIESRYEKNYKLFYTEHAERNCIYAAAEMGNSTRNSTMYIILYPCADCSRAIIQAGVKRVVCENKPDFNNERWGKSWKISEELFNECNVQVKFINK